MEPLGGVLGALLGSQIRPILTYGLSYAAGAMIFVVAEELIPESQMESIRPTKYMFFNQNIAHSFA